MLQNIDFFQVISKTNILLMSTLYDLIKKEKNGFFKQKLVTTNFFFKF